MTSQQQKLSSLAERLSAALEKRNVTASFIAKRAGVDRGYISLLRSGGRRNPSPDVIGKIAEALAVRVDWLLTGNGEMGDAAISETPDEYVTGRVDEAWEKKAKELAGPWLLYFSDAATLRKFTDHVMREEGLDVDAKLEICGFLKNMIHQRELEYGIQKHSR